MEKSEALISVIIPVYNVKDYLDRCLESVVNQTYCGLQILLIDDGSSDGSGELCEQWKKRDSRIETVHKQNEGLGMARNSGMELAKGDFCLFIDSDDYVRKDMAGRLLKTAEQSCADICFGGFVDIWADGRSRMGTAPEQLEYSGEEIITEFAARAVAAPPESSANCFAGVSVCGALYRMDMIRTYDLRFRKEQAILSEDLFFNIAACRAAKKVVLEPDCFYYYCANGESLTKRYRPDRFEAAKRMKYALEKELMGMGSSVSEEKKLQERIQRNFMNSLLVCVRQEAAYEKENGRAWCTGRIREMAEDPETIETLETYPIKRMEKKQRILFEMLRKRRLHLVYWLLLLRYRRK